MLLALQFFGNVDVGTDVSVAELRQRYTAVVLAHGAAEDRVLGVKGEMEMVGMHGGKHFVDWYNGHPDAAGADFALGGATTAVVVG